MEVFPNPVSEVLNIEFSNVINDGILEIYNMTGAKVDEVLVQSKTVSINVKHLTNGLYFINAKVNGRSITNAKFIVNKANSK